MEDYGLTINELKDELEKAKNIRIRAEARLEQLNQQKHEIIKEIKELGITPEELDKEIGRLQNEIEELLGRIRKMLHQDQ